MQKRIRIQKKTARQPEEGVGAGVSQKTNREKLKKKLRSSAELIKEIESLLQEAAAKIKEAERLVQPFRYLPRVPNCEGRMIDLLPRR